MLCGEVFDYSGIKINTRVAGGLWVLGEVVLARGGLTMGSGRVAVFWMWWRIVCHSERNEGSRRYFLTP